VDGKALLARLFESAAEPELGALAAVEAIVLLDDGLDAMAVLADVSQKLRAAGKEAPSSTELERKLVRLSDARALGRAQPAADPKALERTMQAVHEDPNHPLRARFDTAIDEFIVKLQASPEVILKAEQMKEDLLHADAVRQFRASLWSDAKPPTAPHAANPEGLTPQGLSFPPAGLRAPRPRPTPASAPPGRWACPSSCTRAPRR